MCENYKINENSSSSIPPESIARAHVLPGRVLANSAGNGFLKWDCQYSEVDIGVIETGEKEVRHAIRDYPHHSANDLK